MNIYVGVAHFHKNDEIASELIVRRFSLVVEHLTCNQKVLGSNPRNGSFFWMSKFVFIIVECCYFLNFSILE